MTALDLGAAYTTMARVRAFEERAGDLFAAGRLPGFIHLSVGQEAVAVGAIAALRPDDYITATHRGHGQIIAKGGELAPMMAELMGRESGYCRGKGGSMHLFSFDLGVLGANGILGAAQPTGRHSADDQPFGIGGRAGNGLRRGKQFAVGA